MQTTAKKSNPVKDLFGKEELVSGNPQEILEKLGKYGILNLAYAGDRGCNPGYIFRGEAAFDCPLQCSVECDWRYSKTSGAALTPEDLKAKESKLLEDFLKGDGPSLIRIIDPKNGEKSWDDVWWWLSLMQHYERKTRLIDFTRDIRVALYFAIEQHEKRWKRKGERLDLIIYCFPCRDLKHPHDRESNKCSLLPKEEVAGVDMNSAIGRMLDLKWMKVHWASWFHDDGTPRHYTKNGEQRWGWDRPYYQNPRIEFQKGMFVYPYDYPKTALSKRDKTSWLVQNLRQSAENPDDPFNLKEHASTLPPKRIRIPHGCAQDLKKRLRDSFQLTAATIYLDYQREH